MTTAPRFSQLRLEQVIFASMGVLSAMVLLFVGHLLSNAYQEYRAASRLNQVNHLVDHLVTATHNYIFERGRTRVFMSRFEHAGEDAMAGHHGGMHGAMGRSYLDFRSKADNAFAATEAFLAEHPDSDAQKHLRAAIKQRQEVMRLRQEMDRLLNASQDPGDTGEAWSVAMSTMIDSLKAMSGSVSGQLESNEQLGRYSRLRRYAVELSDAVGNAFSFIGGLVGSRATLHMDQFHVLLGDRMLIQSYWSNIVNEASMLNDARMNSVVEAAHQAYFKTYLPMSEGLLKGAWEGEYRMTPHQYTQVAGPAHDALKGVMDSAVLLTDEAVATTQRQSETNLIFTIAAAVAACATMLLAWLFVRTRVTTPLGQLIGIMRQLAKWDTSVTMPNSKGARELSEMTAALEVFKHEIIERQRNAVELVAAKQAAEEGSRAKSAFLSNMSHELRTPMNGVIGMLQLLALGDMTATQRHYVDTALTSANLQLDLINDVLDFSKIEAGKLVLEEIEFDLPQLIDEASAILAHLAHHKRLEMTAYVAPSVPKLVRGDPLRLRQVLSNLIGNAIKFTSEGEIGVELEATQEGILFSIRDSGIGIDPEAQKRLFQPFSQADQSTTRRFGGTGLGLVITRRLVEAMGGEVRLESTLGHGSTFSFCLPLEAVQERTTPTPEHLAQLRFLIVDDSATNREILERYLDAWHLDHLSAAGGPAALELLRKSVAEKSRIDLVLMDMHMPESDGLMTARAIRAEFGDAAPRILLLTSGEQPEKHTLEAAGIALGISKPVSPSRLLDALETLLPRGERHKQAAVAAAPARAREQLACRVLLVEDNKINQQVAMGMLKRLGIQPDIAVNGLEALACLSAATYDLVLMDVQMPKMDGLEATRQWRQQETQEGRLRTPIIAMTAHALHSDRERCIAAGMDDHLAKPMLLPDLESKIKQWMPGGAGAATASQSARE